MNARPWLVAAALTGTLTACGGGSDEDDPGLTKGEDGARAVVRTVAGALAEGNGARACSLMDPSAQRRLSAAQGTTDCLTAVERWAKAHPSAARSGEGTVTLGSGESTAEVTGLGDFTPVTQGGTWRLKVVESRWAVV